MKLLTRKGLCDLEKVKRSDRRWFAQNPSRRYRARLTVLEEYTGRIPAGNTWTIIHGIAPDVCFRAVIGLPYFAVPADNDESLEAIIDACLDARRTGSGIPWIPLECLMPAPGVELSALHPAIWTSAIVGGVQ